MPFAGEGAIVACIGEEVAKGLAFVFWIQRGAVVCGTILMRVEAGHEAGALGAA